MPMILDIPQYSDEWWFEKLGKPSASKMDRIITPSGKPSKQAESYLHELCAERLSGLSANTYQSANMEEGLRREAESRQLFEFIHDVQVEEVGMVFYDETKRFLASPDGIVNREYGLELKNVLPKTQVSYLLKGGLPSDYFVQVQTSLFISGFYKWAFFSYSPGLPPLDLIVPRDNVFIAKLKRLLDDFCDELDAVTDRLRALQ